MTGTHTDRPALRLRFWTQDCIDQLTTAWADGKSASVIGNEFGLTRSAIIGKVHREGLPKRRTQQAAKPNFSSRPRRPNRDVVGLLCNRAADQGKVNLPASKVPVEPTAFRCTLLELTNASCRWPIGGPLEPAKFFCGSPSADLANRMPFCGFHSRYAYQVRTR